MSEACVRFINQLKGEITLYETKHATWRAKLSDLIKQKDSAWTDYDNADKNIATLAPNATFVTNTERRAGGIGKWEWVRCADWGDGECNSRCSDTTSHYTTPQGRRTQWSYYRTSHKNSDCSWAWQHHCVCQYHSIDRSILNTLKDKYDDLVKQ